MTEAGGGLAWRCKAQVSRWRVRPDGPGLLHISRFSAPLRSSFQIFLSVFWAALLRIHKGFPHAWSTGSSLPQELSGLLKADAKGSTHPADPIVLPTHLGKHLRFRAWNDQAWPASHSGGLSCEYNKRERGGGSEGMWPYVTYDPQLSSPSPLKPSLVTGSACATSRVCPKRMIPRIFAGLVLIHLTESRPKIYTAAIPTFIYFMNDKRFYSFILPLLLCSSTRNLFC